MASEARIFDWLSAILVVLAGILCAVPLAGQSIGRSLMRQPVDTSAISADITPEAWPDRVPADVDALIEQMSLAADVIFAGQVMAVRRSPRFAGSWQDAAEGIVEVDIHVDQSLRGPASGSTYTLREWAGLWSGLGAGSSDRYRPGQRLLFFLYAADAHGLSAPVHGAEGAIPLRGSGIAPGPDDATPAAAEWLVDLRWLQTEVPRRRTLQMLPVRRPINQSLSWSIASERTLDLSHAESEPLPFRRTQETLFLETLFLETWLPPVSAPAETQPLSQVLALCYEAIRLDAMRSRNANR